MTTTNTTPILELWKAMGDAGIETKDIREMTVPDPQGSMFSNTMPADNTLKLHASTGRAEKWLRGRGWKPSKYWGRYCPPDPRIDNRTDFVLSAAIRAEAGRK